MFKTIFWDNDGVLVHTEPLYFEAAKEILSSIGVELTREWYVHEKLKKNTNVFNLAREKGFSEDQIKDLKQQRNQLYENRLRENVPVIDGVRDVLEQLQDEFFMGVVTSSRRCHFDIIMEQSGFIDFFSFFITREDFVKEKPDPEPYLLALEITKSDPNTCLVIEDTERGVCAAKAAGLTCFAIPNDLSEENDFSAADKVLKSIRELPGIIMS